MGLRLELAALTDVGCVRRNNEDSFGYDETQRIYVVCDGMGGMAAGEVASGAAVEHLLAAYRQPASDLSMEERLYRAIAETNAAVRALGLARPQLNGMGTTLVAACFDGSRLVVGNVGDSRAYFLRGGTCVQITRDHSLVAEQLHHGLITPEMAASSPYQSVITRAIGTEADVEPDLFAAELEDRDTVLLATDGLTRYLESGEIASVVNGENELENACRRMVEMTKERGAADNITCLLLRAAGES
jgi:serine/threonine protein phosphatase PrpC